MNRILGALALVCALAAAALPPARAGGPTVVELFTSQGCSSCPPADALLAELAGRDDVLALSLHVDYWDYIGWKDPFAAAACTERQRDYARHFGLGYVYTPQMVVQGRHQMTGSDRAAVLAAIGREAAMPRMTVAIEGGAAAAAAILPARDGGESATVWAATFDYEHTTRVERGENKGRTLSYANVVRELRRIGAWNGEAVRVALPMTDLATGSDAVAVLVQADAGGAILGAGVLALTPRP